MEVKEGQGSVTTNRTNRGGGRVEVKEGQGSVTTNRMGGGKGGGQGRAG